MHVRKRQKTLPGNKKRQNTSIDTHPGLPLNHCDWLTRNGGWLNDVVHADLQGVVGIAWQIGLEMDQQPFDTTIGPSRERPSLERQGLRSIFDRKLCRII